jgi:hypothetical protein
MIAAGLGLSQFSVCTCAAAMFAPTNSMYDLSLCLRGSAQQIGRGPHRLSCALTVWTGGILRYRSWASVGVEGAAISARRASLHGGSYRNVLRNGNRQLVYVAAEGAAWNLDRLSVLSAR